jgi:hypothetical protein
MDYQHQAEEHIRRAQGLPSGFPSVSAWTKAMFEPFASAFPGPKTSTAPNPEPARGGENAELRELVRELQEQVAELKRVRTGAQKPRRRR